MSESKPFFCGFAGCDKTFTNEDHLSVHQNKHSLAPLHLVADDNAVILPFADQTPTPTKFFRVEEGRLFEEISASGSPANPFDDQFRKATSTKLTHDVDDQFGNATSTTESSECAAVEKAGPDVGKPLQEDENFNYESESTSTLSSVPDLPSTLSLKRSHSNSSDAPSKKVSLQGPRGELIPVSKSFIVGSKARDKDARSKVTLRIKVDKNAGRNFKNNAPIRKSSKQQRIRKTFVENDTFGCHGGEDDSLFDAGYDNSLADDDNSLAGDDNHLLEAMTQREKILARNRESAWRARQKKKNRVQNLEKDCDDLREENERLQLELMATKRELVSAKDLLREHVIGGCDIGRKQRAEGRLTRDLIDVVGIPRHQPVLKDLGSKEKNYQKCFETEPNSDCMRYDFSTSDQNQNLCSGHDRLVLFNDQDYDCQEVIVEGDNSSPPQPITYLYYPE